MTLGNLGIQLMVLLTVEISLALKPNLAYCCAQLLNMACGFTQAGDPAVTLPNHEARLVTPQGSPNSNHT